MPNYYNFTKRKMDNMKEKLAALSIADLRLLQRIADERYQDLAADQRKERRYWVSVTDETESEIDRRITDIFGNP